MKENQHVRPVVNVDAGTVTFEVKGHESIVLDMSKLHPDIIKRAALAGMAQVRIVDAAAVGMTDDEGNILSESDRIEMKYARMAALVDHYHTGTSEWTVRGSGTGGNRSITIEAIARVKSMSYEDAVSAVDKFAEAKGLDRKKALAKFRESRQVAEAISAIRAERAPAPKADADEMLKELV
jgi:hypothetical protein